MFRSETFEIIANDEITVCVLSLSNEASELNTYNFSFSMQVDFN